MDNLEEKAKKVAKKLIEQDIIEYKVKEFAYREEDRREKILFSGKSTDSLKRLSSSLPLQQVNDKIAHVKNKPMFTYGSDLEITYKDVDGGINIVIKSQNQCGYSEYEVHKGQNLDYSAPNKAYFYDYISFVLSEKGQVDSISLGVMQEDKQEKYEMDTKGLFKRGTMSKTDRKVKKLIEQHKVVSLSKEIVDLVISYIDKIKKENDSVEKEDQKEENVSIKKEEQKLEKGERKVVDIIEYVKEKTVNGELLFEEAQKFQRILARQGQVGEKVQTILADGTKETDYREVKLDKKTNEPGWVVNNVDGPEQWIIEDSVFKKKYEVDSENPEVYKPKGGPMLASQIKEDITFAPPMWGGDIQNIKAGGYLLMDPTNPQDIYGIGEVEFYNTYSFVNNEKKTR